MGRLEFAKEFSKAGIRAANTRTVFGQLWLVLNPLLLSLVYYFLVSVLSEAGGWAYLAHITGGLFLFTFFSASVSSGSGSVVGGGGLVMSMSLPRLLLPLAAVRTSFVRFLPTIPVFLAVRIIASISAGEEPLLWHPRMLLGIYFLVLMIMFASGVAFLISAVQVYFRDTSSFLPYFLRIWLYVSPVLWATDRLSGTTQQISWLNPLYSIIGGWSDLVVRAQMPHPATWFVGLGWALLAAVGGAIFFMSRERDFAVRL